MWGLISALAAGWAVWSPSFGRSERPKKLRVAKPQAWVTVQALRLSGWTPAILKQWQAGSALVVALIWWAVTKSVVAGLVMAWAGWQLPIFWAELRAGRILSQQVRQVSQFIGAVADGLNTGQSIPLAVDSAARQITTPPLGEAADTLIRRINGGARVQDALTQMGESIDWQWWKLFCDMTQLVQEAGGTGSLFDDLSWQLQEADRIQSEFRVLTATFVGLVAIFTLLIVGGAVISAVTNPTGWAHVTRHFQWVLIVSSGIAVYCFGGIRKYARMGIQLEP